MFILTPGCVAIRYGAPTLLQRTPQADLVIEIPVPHLQPGADHHDALHTDPLMVGFPENGWVHGFRIEVLDAQGDTLPAGVLHHLKAMAVDRRELFSPIMLRVIGAGAETGPTQVPSTLGFRLEAGDTLLITGMVHNPTAAPISNGRVRLTLHYTPESSGRRPTDIYPFFLHVTPPDEDSSYDLPPGYSVRSFEAQPAVDGRIIGFGGHLHPYGVSVRFEDATTGRVYWRGTGVTSDDGTEISVSRDILTWSAGIPLVKSHVYRVTAVYHNPTGDTIPAGGMGTIAGAFVPSEPWPAINRQDPLYLLDRMRESSGEDHQVDHSTGHGDHSSH